MNIYIAAPYSCRNFAIAVMTTLELRGHVVTSRWLKDDSETLNDEWARNDLYDVASADALFALNLPGWEDKGTGGRHVEFGYALALGKRIVLVGQRSNIFHYLNAVLVVSTIDEAMDAL